MANLKKEIEDRLIVNERVLQLFEAETLFDDKVKKYISSKTEKIKSDSDYDLDNYLVTLVSNTPIEKHIHVKAIISSTLSMQGGNLRKVIYNGTRISETLGVYTAEVSFIMVHSFEKTGIRLFSRR